MNYLKMHLVKSILILIALNCLLNAFLDFSRLSSYKEIYYILPNEILKRLNVLLAALLIWIAGKNQLDSADNIRMKLLFVVIGLGELYFLLGKPNFAIGFFMACQLILIFRHSKGLTKKLMIAGPVKRLLLFISAFTILSGFIFAIAALYPVLIINSTVIMGALYGIILSISLWIAFANYILGLFPYPSSKLIAIGMLCFYMCDVMVALDGLLSHGPPWLLASSLIWLFYTPAITMLALSTYDLKARLQISQT